MSQSTCLVCGAATAGQWLACTARTRNFGKRVEFFECGRCGYVAAPANRHDFHADGFGADNDPDAGHGRGGSATLPGREYHMATMACAILDLAQVAEPRLMVFGPGMSLDHHRIARDMPRAKVAITDLDNFQGAANFVPLDDGGRYDAIIACEVVEHFTDPVADFARLLAKLSPGGLLVCSTNVNDGTPLAQLEYPFISGHTSYYSARSLARIAAATDTGIEVDFRTPEAALHHLGPRKRYVLMHRCDAVRAAIADYFSRVPFAPSEPGRPPKLRVRLRAFARALRFTAGRLGRKG